MAKYEITENDGAWFVCRADMPRPMFVTKHDSRATAEAMIARLYLADAAPDLLETLKSIERSLPLIDLMSCGYLADEIRAAIAKAEGTTP